MENKLVYTNANMYTKRKQMYTNMFSCKQKGTQVDLSVFTKSEYK